jgi:HEAT repeat protein
MIDPAEGRALARAATTLDELVAAVRHESPDVRAEAIPRLRARFPAERAAYEVLVAATRDDDEHVRFTAYAAVGNTEMDGAADVLVRGLHDPERVTRWYVAAVLGARGDPRAPADPDEWAGPDPDDCGVP